MSVVTNTKKNVSSAKEEEDDKEMQEELALLVDRIIGKDKKLIIPSLEMLKFIIRTSTTSMTSVPKPLKYLMPYYAKIKEAYTKMEDSVAKKKCADIISVLAMGPTGGDQAKDQRECLRYCLLGTQKSLGDWGHEYLRQLESEIVDQWATCQKSATLLLPLVKDVVKYDCKYHAELQACDLLMEIDKLELLPPYIQKDTYPRICLYLQSNAKYVDDIEAAKILEITAEQYMKFEEYSKALIIYLQMRKIDMVHKIFELCKDHLYLRQLAFMVARQLFNFELPANVEIYDELNTIISNNYLSTYFQNFARELDIMEPKTPEEVYKSWLEPTPNRLHVLGATVDSARQNLASSFVNGFVNAGFGCDKMLTTDGGNKWIYRNKEHGMVSATASLGLLHLWDVDGGLTPIDKYLYTADENVKAGALLALGLVNCRVRNECDPALALLAEYVTHTSNVLKTQSIFGLGLAYIGTQRTDVLDILIPAVENANQADLLAVASLSCGLVGIGSCNGKISNAILSKLVDVRESESLKAPHMRLVVLGLGFCYMGCKDTVETINTALEVFTDPFRTTAQTIIEFCAYAATGDVLLIQELLHLIGDKTEEAATPSKTKSSTNRTKSQESGKNWDYSIPQAVAALGVAVISLGDEVGVEMMQRILGNIWRYGDAGVRRAVPLAIAMTSISNPQLNIIDVLTKYSHDTDDEVACIAIFCLGIVGAGTNNARLASGLRQMAVYHARNPSQLFMVRLAQGLTHMAKGTVTLNPMHTDKQLVDYCSLAGLLIPMLALIEPQSLILGRSHYLLYGLAAAIHPRWLLTLDENLAPANLTVRVGQAVDIVAKAGTPKSIIGIRTHITPVLLASGERAELTTDDYETIAPVLEGICLIKAKEEVDYKLKK